MLLINLLVLNGMYIGFSLLNYNQASDIKSCEAIGLLLHYFLLTTFGLVMSMAILRFAKTTIKNPTKYSWFACILVYRKCFACNTIG